MTGQPDNSAANLCEIAAHARSGHFEPLARHIVDGGDLSEDLRQLMALVLRGELKFKPGNRRTHAQATRERSLAQWVRILQVAEARMNGLRGSLRRAKDRTLNAHAGLTDESLKKYMMRSGVEASPDLDFADQAFRFDAADQALDDPSPPRKPRRKG